MLIKIFEFSFNIIKPLPIFIFAVSKKKKVSNKKYYYSSSKIDLKFWIT